MVTTIYETLGATIQVPHTGSKTIRVRLTVAPENRGTANNTPQQSPQKPNTYHHSHKPATPASEESSHPLHKLSCNKESLYHNLSPSKLANNAEQLYSQLNFSSTNNKCKNNEVYYTLNSPSMTPKLADSSSVHHCQHRGSPTMGHKVATVRVCNNESCSSPYKTTTTSTNTTNTRLLNNEEATRLLCDVETSPKPCVRFCNNETGHISPIVNNVESPLTTKKLSNDAARRDTATSKTLPSNSTPNSPVRVGNLARASVSVSSPRTSGEFALCMYLRTQSTTLQLVLTINKNWQ